MKRIFGRKAFLVVWLALPAVAGAYHFGPGKRSWAREQASQHTARGDTASEEEDWPAALESYEAAIGRLEGVPGSEEALRRLRLARAKARMQASQLPVAYEELGALVREAEVDEAEDPAFVAEVRAAAANAGYYMTWLMRLEGLGREEWEPVVEGARQHYRILAEQARAAGQPEERRTREEDLEASIRLARMDLSELQGLPLPSQ